ncbi:MAG: bifunctional DNA-formamidopyrimidine glycosylase/DNA-(apurinic or apyrimidinic site) lyase [Planctomycetia bacterium]|nr:bifunctional DNA-formamidopyrimidine glycosylase/DNA-(apurinic or apyrimidinic site) lyase [Planctomycetia bacterium]
MPELPEVETMRRGIAHLAGLRIDTASFPRSSVRPIVTRPAPARLRRRLAGRTIVAVHRFGKRVVLELDAVGPENRGWLVIEPRMTGLLLVVDPPTRTHVRMELGIDSRACPRLIFWDRRGLGTIRLLDAGELAAACGPARLGPDGLVVTGSALAERLGGSRRAVKVALLDQRAVAGIGNIYAAEILFAAGIDPRTACRRLRPADWERIAAAARSILEKAVRMEGSSIGDETYRTADNRTGRFQRQHRVYGRAGEACHACGGPVVRLVQAQRSTFFCPCCQWQRRR